jgi:hypothetical protein
MIITISEKEILKYPNEADLGRFVKHKYLEIKESLEYDNCIICDNVTPYKKSTPVNNRYGYIEGAGQACFKPNSPECHKKQS